MLGWLEGRRSSQLLLCTLFRVGFFIDKFSAISLPGEPGLLRSCGPPVSSPDLLIGLALKETRITWKSIENRFCRKNDVIRLESENYFSHILFTCFLRGIGDPLSLSLSQRNRPSGWGGFSVNVMCGIWGRPAIFNGESYPELWIGEYGERGSLSIGVENGLPGYMLKLGDEQKPSLLPCSVWVRPRTCGREYRN